MKMVARLRGWQGRAWAGLAGVLAALASAHAGPVEWVVLDSATGRPIPCRIHLQGPDAKPVRALALPFWRDHFVCPGRVRLELPAGRYSIEVERGPEYRSLRESLEVPANQPLERTLSLGRIADLAGEGWWSGELHVHRPPEDIELLMQAEDLHVAPVITWWNRRNLWSGRALPAEPLVHFDGNRYYHLMGGEDERGGGALMYFNLSRPLDITRAAREHPSPVTFLAEAKRRPGAWADIEKPFWWDAPTWVATGLVDSIGLANNHMCRSRMLENEAWGRARDARRLPPPRGNGFWTQEIYYRLLNCGVRLPPSAGSASGVLPNPVGYNRVYVHLGEALDYAQWWKGLKAGRSFVTNGPLLRCRANGHLPGHVFRAAEGQRLKLEITGALTSRDPIPFVEIVKNGRVERKVSFGAAPKTQTFGEVEFDRSGWFLVRAIADVPQTFRFASTAPFYVEVGESRKRISRESARFFRDWVRQRMERIELEDAAQRREVLAPHRKAVRLWEEKLAQANAE